MTTTANTQDNVVDLLLAQHDRIRTLLSDIESSHGDRRRDSFDELRRFLAVHETAEEMVVHPTTRRQGPEGENVADARLEEENEGKQVLSELDDLDVDEPEFAKKFATFKKAVSEHAKHEESEEFPILRRAADADDMKRMARAVRAAEAIAPTHPHAGVESQAGNMAVGPIAAVIDRTRDAVRSAMDG